MKSPESERSGLQLFNSIDQTNDIQFLFEQYKLYVEMMDKVSERRHNANSFFLTVNTILISILSAVIGASNVLSFGLSWILIASVAGALLCVTWWTLIASYRQLNQGKFIIIHLLESRLPARLFDAEWEALKEIGYRPFSRLERIVPIVFTLMYIALGMFAVL